MSNNDETKNKVFAYSYSPCRISECQSGYKGAYSAPFSPVLPILMLFH